VPFYNWICDNPSKSKNCILTAGVTPKTSKDSTPGAFRSSTSGSDSSAAV
jgi:hypothetical protein